MKNNKEIKNEQSDTVAAMGIGAMIVFIALILVAAVASAVIIQTAEKLQQKILKSQVGTIQNVLIEKNSIGYTPNFSKTKLNADAIYDKLINIQNIKDGNSIKNLYSE